MFKAKILAANVAEFCKQLQSTLQSSDIDTELRKEHLANINALQSDANTLQKHFHKTCKYWQNGTCRFGSACVFLHDVIKRTELCRYGDHCWFRERCTYTHLSKHQPSVDAASGTVVVVGDEKKQAQVISEPVPSPKTAVLDKPSISDQSQRPHRRKPRFKKKEKQTQPKKQLVSKASPKQHLVPVQEVDVAMTKSVLSQLTSAAQSYYKKYPYGHGPPPYLDPDFGKWNAQQPVVPHPISPSVPGQTSLISLSKTDDIDNPVDDAILEGKCLSEPIISDNFESYCYFVPEELLNKPLSFQVNAWKSRGQSTIYVFEKKKLKSTTLIHLGSDTTKSIGDCREELSFFQSVTSR